MKRECANCPWCAMIVTAHGNTRYICADEDGKPYPKSEQVARCGNAVCPPIPTALVRANLPEPCKGVA